MLHIANEYETTIDSKYYQNNVNNSNLEETSNSQKTKNYTPHVIDNNSDKKSIYQKTKKQDTTTKRKDLDNPTFIRELKKQNFSITRSWNWSLYRFRSRSKHYKASHMEGSLNPTSKTFSFETLKWASYSLKIEYYKLWKNSIILCSNPNNETK